MKYIINLLNFVDKLFRVLNIIGVTYDLVLVLFICLRACFWYLVRVACLL